MTSFASNASACAYSIGAAICFGLSIKADTQIEASYRKKGESEFTKLARIRRAAFHNLPQKIAKSVVWPIFIIPEIISNRNVSKQIRADIRANTHYN